MLLLAGFTKGVIGFGLPSISMGLLGLVMPPSQAAALLLAPNIITNVQQGLVGPALRPLLKRLALFFATIVAGALLWEWALGGQDLRWASKLLGLTLILYALLGLFKLRFRIAPRHETLGAALSGLTTGAMTVATGVFVIPSGPFLQAIGLEKDELVQSLGLTFLVASITLGLILLWRGNLGAGLAGGSLAALIPAMAAMVAGQWMRGRISDALFRKLFYCGLLALGAFSSGRAERLFGNRGDGQEARTAVRNRRVERVRSSHWLSSVSAAVFTSSAIAPVPEAASEIRLTPAVAAAVPASACRTLCEIIWVTAFCCSIACATALDDRLNRRIASVTSLIARDEPAVASWTSAIRAPISVVACAVFAARTFTSDATTAKPLPASPALAASIVALSARRFVCEAIVAMISTISPICFRFRGERADLLPRIARDLDGLLRIRSPTHGSAG